MKPREAGHRPSPPIAGRQPTLRPDAQSSDAAWLLVFAAWVVASSATLGALFFSEVMDLPPCLLCWYQRIFMFPLLLLLSLGLFPFDPKVTSYGLALALPGLGVAVYHQLLVMGIVPESASPCTRGIPCAEVQIQWLGFVTIPLLAVAAFAAIVALLLLARTRTRR